MLRNWRIPGIVLLMGVFVLTGCSKKVTRTVDVSDGEYYTQDEFKSLSKAQRNEYCQTLASELTRLESEGEQAKSQNKSNAEALSKLRAEASGMNSEVGALESEVAELQRQIQELENLPTSYTVIPGDFLYRISEYPDIYNDPLRWPRIYRANEDVIGEDPNLIYPDQVFTIPREWPDSYVVREDDFLARIASYWWIFGDPTRWADIYEANRDQLSDPDMIYPEQQLRIPR